MTIQYSTPLISNKLSSLPAAQKYGKLKQAIRDNRLVFVTGGTGSGKSVVTPIAIVEELKGQVIVTQNRRVLCNSISSYIAEQSDLDDDAIGYCYKGAYKYGHAISFETVGTVLKKIESDYNWIKQVECIVIDEIHEKTAEQYMLLSQIQLLLNKFEHLKIVLMSATLDQSLKEELTDFFNVSNAEVALSSFGRYPVIKLFTDIDPSISLTEADYEKPFNEIRDIVLSNLCDVTIRSADYAFYQSVLVFLPGVFEINKLKKLLISKGVSIPIFTLTGSTSENDKERLISYAGNKIILATNVARSGITIPNVRTVISSGFNYVPTYDYDRSVAGLKIELTDWASLMQEGGRTGRNCTGNHIILGPRNLKRAEQPKSPFAISDITLNILKQFYLIRSFGKKFEWFEQPDIKAFRQSIELLKEIQALETDSKGALSVSKKGEQLLNMPFNIRLSNFVWNCQQLGIGLEGAIVAAAIESRLSIDPSWAKTQTTYTKTHEISRRKYENDLIAIVDTYKNNGFSESEQEIISDTIKSVGFDISNETKLSREDIIENLQIAAALTYPDKIAYFVEHTKFTFLDTFDETFLRGNYYYTGVDNNAVRFTVPSWHRYNKKNTKMEGTAVIPLNLFNLDGSYIANMVIDIPFKIIEKYVSPKRVKDLNVIRSFTTFEDTYNPSLEFTRKMSAEERLNCAIFGVFN